MHKKFRIGALCRCCWLRQVSPSSAQPSRTGLPGERRVPDRRADRVCMHAFTLGSVRVSCELFVLSLHPRLQPQMSEPYRAGGWTHAPRQSGA